MGSDVCKKVCKKVTKKINVPKNDQVENVVTRLGQSPFFFILFLVRSNVNSKWVEYTKYTVFGKIVMEFLVKS